MKREQMLKEIVEYYGLKDNAKVYTIIPNIIIGDYGLIGTVEGGKIDLEKDQWGHKVPIEKGFKRKVCGFLTTHKKMFKALDSEGNFYLIDGTPLMGKGGEYSNMFKLSNGQLYYVEQWDGNVLQNYYFRKKDSREILELFEEVRENKYRELIANNLSWLFSIMDN